MDKRAEKEIEQISGQDRGLERLLRVARIYEALDRRVRPALSEALREHVSVACVESDCLVLAADSPAWATRARLEAPDALQAAREVWPDTLRKTRVIVSGHPA